MPEKPTDRIMRKKNAHLERLEKKCAAVARMAQKRLDTSAAIRSGWVSVCAVLFDVIYVHMRASEAGQISFGACFPPF